MTINSLEKWLENSKDKIFSIWQIKEIFTPYEQSEKFSDENTYENMGEFKIVDCFTYGYKIYFGCSLVLSETEVSNQIDYFDLDKIKLTDITKDYFEENSNT